MVSEKRSTIEAIPIAMRSPMTTVTKKAVSSTMVNVPRHVASPTHTLPNVCRAAKVDGTNGRAKQSWWDVAPRMVMRHLTT
jgi:hypothetical protein